MQDEIWWCHCRALGIHLLLKHFLTFLMKLLSFVLNNLELKIQLNRTLHLLLLKQLPQAFDDQQK